MTKISYKWTKPGFTPIVFNTWADAKEMIKHNGGSYETIYIEGKDVDYCPPKTDTKRFNQRVSAY